MAAAEDNPGGFPTSGTTVNSFAYDTSSTTGIVENDPVDMVFTAGGGPGGRDCWECRPQAQTYRNADGDNAGWYLDGNFSVDASDLMIVGFSFYLKQGFIDAIEEGETRITDTVANISSITRGNPTTFIFGGSLPGWATGDDASFEDMAPDWEAVLGTGPNAVHEITVTASDRFTIAVNTTGLTAYAGGGQANVERFLNHGNKVLDLDMWNVAGSGRTDDDSTYRVVWKLMWIDGGLRFAILQGGAGVDDADDGTNENLDLSDYGDEWIDARMVADYRSGINHQLWLRPSSTGVWVKCLEITNANYGGSDFSDTGRGWYGSRATIFGFWDDVINAAEGSTIGVRLVDAFIADHWPV